MKSGTCVLLSVLIAALIVIIVPLLAMGIATVSGQGVIDEPEPVAAEEATHPDRDQLAADIYAGLVAARPVPMGRTDQQYHEALAQAAYAAADTFLAESEDQQKDD